MATAFRGSRRLTVLLGLLLLTAATAVWWRRGSRVGEPLPAGVGAAEVRRLIAAISAIERREGALDESLWAPDVLAQRCGRIVDDLWDAVNAATDRWAVLESLTIPRMRLPQFAPPMLLAHGIRVGTPTGEGISRGPEGWPALIGEARRAGWRLVQVELRHNRFDWDERGAPRSSVFHFTAHLANDSSGTRATLTGDLGVGWTTDGDAEGLPGIGSVDASRVAWLSRVGPVPFDLVFQETVRPFDKTHFIDPLILRDLDGDGLSEIILAARNIVYHREGWDRFREEALCQHAPGLLFTAVIADFDGDGWEDFLAARFAGLVLYRGSPQGRFDRPGEEVWSVQPHLRYGQVLTCGDVDGDGDLDVWLGQYKGPYTLGQMPSPYYDANDGNPSFLLLNDGAGVFADATEAAGLAAKRWRRSYSGSFIDLDRDGVLDLVVVSDFAGVDVYRNQGRGRFTDVTGSWLPESHAFGMAHAFGDWDGDGRLDLLVMGMNCPTAQRLDALGLARSEWPDHGPMRSRMVAGNRLYLGREEGGFGFGGLGRSIATSGWSWGCSTADFDNDGFPDVAVANGHESKKTVHDYEPEFWRHDIYVADSRNDPAVHGYFAAKMARTRGEGQSYGGYEKNRLYLNQAGREFVEVGHLMGVAMEEDSRCLVTDDLDGDGRVDLVVTTFEAWPQVRQTVRVYRNRFEESGHWIGVRLVSHHPRCSPVGARVTVEAGGRRHVRAVVTGDSHRSQHASTVHVGLGTQGEVSRLTVVWPGGQTNVIVNPTVDVYHRVEPMDAP